MTPKETVLSHWPRAGAIQHRASWLIVPDRKTEYEQEILGIGYTANDAWIDAARRIQEGKKG